MMLPRAKKPRMYLKHLYLKNFSNYRESEAAFSSGLNVFCGNNAQGKTNLLEAIFLISTGRSFRTDHLQELIRQGESFFFLEAVLEKDGVSQKVALSFDGTNKRLQIDGNSYSTFAPLLGLLPFVLYQPQDVELIYGSPAIRRRFLNMHLAQSDPLYVHHLSRFWRAMKQRNALLRMNSTTGIEPWEEEMQVSAQYLWFKRSEMLKKLSLKNHLLSQETHQLELTSPPKSYLQALQRNRAREMQLGLTLAGPHRDELHLFIDDKPAKIYASEGQKNTFIAALRLAEWELLSQEIGEPALLGIDDWGVHLDKSREEKLKEALERPGQIFLTTPRKEIPHAREILIEQGQVL